MSHLELLMQKGDIQGPPYSMSKDIELTFLRKFIERHNAGIPHNPRLRNGNASDWPAIPKDDSMNSGTPEPSESGSANATDPQMMPEGESRMTNGFLLSVLIITSDRDTQCSSSEPD
jgi:hypothetical protein